jgi:hypothetical protein
MLASHPDTRASLILRLQNAEDIAAWNDFVAIYVPVTDPASVEAAQVNCKPSAPAGRASRGQWILFAPCRRARHERKF